MESHVGLRRVQVLLLLVAVMLVPALTRATQHVSYWPLSQEASGFSRSSDSAPDPVTVSPDIQIVDHVAIVIVHVAEPAWVMERPEEALRSLASAPVPRPLRAPPAVAL
jgi:hypothetical protein